MQSKGQHPAWESAHAWPETLENPLMQGLTNADGTFLVQSNSQLSTMASFAQVWSDAP
jgi:hypothetical protein